MNTPFRGSHGETTQDPDHGASTSLKSAARTTARTGRISASLPTGLIAFEPASDRCTTLVWRDRTCRRVATLLAAIVNQVTGGEMPPPITVFVNWQALLKK